MDDEKSTLEKVTETVKGAMETIVDGAKSMVSPESGTPINMPHNESGADIERAASTKKRSAMKVPDPEGVARTTNEQVYIPEATDAAATPAPLLPARKQKRSASPATKQVAGAKKAAPKTSNKNAKKAAKKAKKTTAKKSRSKKAARTSKKKASTRRR